MLQSLQFFYFIFNKKIITITNKIKVFLKLFQSLVFEAVVQVIYLS